MLLRCLFGTNCKYNNYLPGSDNIYRIYNERKDNATNSKMACVPPAFATYMKQNYPEVETTARILMESGKRLWETGDVKSYEEKGLLTEDGFFEIFPLS